MRHAFLTAVFLSATPVAAATFGFSTVVSSADQSVEANADLCSFLLNGCVGPQVGLGPNDRMEGVMTGRVETVDGAPVAIGFDTIALRYVNTAGGDTLDATFSVELDRLEARVVNPAVALVAPTRSTPLDTAPSGPILLSALLSSMPFDGSFLIEDALWSVSGVASLGLRIPFVGFTTFVPATEINPQPFTGPTLSGRLRDAGGGGYSLDIVFGIDLEIDPDGPFPLDVRNRTDRPAIEVGFSTEAFALSPLGDPVDPDVGVIPLPAAGWLLLSGLGGLAALRAARRKA